MGIARRVGGVTVVVAVTALGFSGPAIGVVPTPTIVNASVETAPVTLAGDAADDPAIWVHPTNPSQSLVLANDKKGSLETYNLDGSKQQRVTTGRKFWGNVDVRQGVTIVGRTRDVVAAQNNGVRTFTVSLPSRTLVPIGEGNGAFATGGGEGLCLYHSEVDSRLYVFTITRPGQLRQFRLHDDDDDGLLQGTLMREFPIGSEAEGCVADDARGVLYVSQEDVALWRYGAEPDAGSSRTQIDTVQPSGNLSADIEGVTLVDTGGTGGYVIASAQNVKSPKKSYFVVYDRQTNDYLGAFRIADGPATDGCERTDGIAAYAGNLGPQFPQGVFVCQDNTNSGPAPGNQNFKLTRLERIVDLD